MTPDIRNLALQLRAWSEPIASGYEVPAAARTLHAAAGALEAMAGEVERLKSQRDEYLQFWKNNAEACEAAEAERDRLKAALEGMVHYAGHAGWWQDENPEYLEAARKALGGDA